jgi:hypothetical protein
MDPDPHSIAEPDLDPADQNQCGFMLIRIRNTKVLNTKKEFPYFLFWAVSLLS